MLKYIPPEKRTIHQIIEEIKEEFMRWNHIAKCGCQDPFWTDGDNMNLVRNHIIYSYMLLADKVKAADHLSLFESEEIKSTIKPIPPKVPDGYMVSDCPYSHRLDKWGHTRQFIWGKPGEYQA